MRDNNSKILKHFIEVYTHIRAISNSEYVLKFKCKIYDPKINRSNNLYNNNKKSMALPRSALIVWRFFCYNFLSTKIVNCGDDEPTK